MTNPANNLAAINSLTSASKANFDACVDVITHAEQVNAIQMVSRLHHLKFNANGEPMVEELAECLVRHVIDYCLSARKRSQPLTPQEAVKYTQEARRLFVHPDATPDDPDQTGEAGEILLYFLIENVLGAPQIVAKMDLKTNPSLEVFGSDGIHMSWNATDKVVDLFFGESKIYQNVGAAISKAIESIENFHANDMRRHEFSMVTNHFKHTDDNIRKAVTDLLDAGVPGGTARINHACLIGYNWDEYGTLPKLALPALVEEFQKRYLDDAPRLHKLLEEKFKDFKRKELRFQVFFIPFKCVQAFRTAFNKALD